MIEKMIFLIDNDYMQARTRNPVARRLAIRRALAARETVSVDELCRELDASPATIRRDLAALEDQALIERTFGGAAVRAERPAEQAFAIRDQQDVEAKRQIALAALGIMQSGSTVFLNDGSTVMSIAREIVAAGRDVFVATPAVNVAAKLSESSAVTVCLLGGFVSQTSLATSGPFAEAMAAQINADLALISPDGISATHGISFAHADDAALARKMIAQSRRTAVVATSAKFQRVGRITAAAAADIDVVITDAIGGATAGEMRDVGIDLIVADGNAAARRPLA
jgi:DeoR/GlpR family transcriptional regulator of sugar metabolism